MVSSHTPPKNPKPPPPCCVAGSLPSPSPAPSPLQALEQYKNVLRAEPRNVYAANGVGAVLVRVGVERVWDLFQSFEPKTLMSPTSWVQCWQ
jgi:hypothetical protein